MKCVLCLVFGKFFSKDTVRQYFKLMNDFVARIVFHFMFFINFMLIYVIRKRAYKSVSSQGSVSGYNK